MSFIKITPEALEGGTLDIKGLTPVLKELKFSKVNFFVVYGCSVAADQAFAQRHVDREAHRPALPSL
jgi:hypothetical protein